MGSFGSELITPYPRDPRYPAWECLLWTPSPYVIGIMIWIPILRPLKGGDLAITGLHYPNHMRDFPKSGALCGTPKYAEVL